MKVRSDSDYTFKVSGDPWIKRIPVKPWVPVYLKTILPKVVCFLNHEDDNSLGLVAETTFLHR